MKKKIIILSGLVSMILAAGNIGNCKNVVYAAENISVESCEQEMSSETDFTDGESLDSEEVPATEEGALEPAEEGLQMEDPEVVEKDTDLAVQETEKRFVDGTEEAIEGNSSDEAEFTIEDGVLKSYNYGGMVKGTVVVPDDVTTIGMSAFEHAYVDKVILGKNVRTIEAFAFNGCRMKEIEGMENVTSIGMEAFYNCERLLGIKFGSNLESIGSSAFEKCSSLTGEVVFPENVKLIEESAFADTDVQKAIFRCKDGEYRNNLFSNDASLKEIQIYGGSLYRNPTGVVFGDLDGLEKVYIGPDVKDLGYHGFSDCKNLKEVTLENGSYDTIGMTTFSGCISLTTIEIPDNIKSIGSWAFSETGISDIDLNQVETLSEGVLSYCKNLTSIKMDNVTSIGQGGFIGCDSLKEIVFPPKLKEIGSDILWNLPSLEKVTVTGAETVFDGGMADDCKNLKTVEIQAGKVKGWFDNLDTLKVGPGVCEVDNLNGSIKHVVVEGDSQLKLLSNAFSGIEDLESAKISGKIAIPQYCFSNCSNLSSVILSDGITSVGTGAFKETPALKELVIPDSVKTLSSLFIDDSGIEKLTVPFLGEDGRCLWHAQLSNLKQVTVKSGKIGAEVFEGCKNLEKVEIGDSVTEIAERAFGDCPKLKKITVPSGVKRIGIHALGMKLTKVADKTRPGVYYISAVPYFPKEKFQLYGYVSTAAEEYAKKTEGIQFNSLGGKLSGPNVYLSAGSVSYNGSARTPVPVVKAGNTALKKDVDYTVTYKKNRNIGTAQVIIKGKGKYSGTVTKTFKITLAKNALITVNKVKYKVTGVATNGKGTVSVNGVTDKTARTTLNIGATVKIGGVTYRITSIGTSAFAGAARLRSVKMGANITTIGAKAFLNCKALSNMEISTKSLSMNRTGNSAFKGIKFNCTVKVPKQKNSLYKKILRAKGAGKNIRVTN